MCAVFAPCAKPLSTIERKVQGIASVVPDVVSSASNATTN